MRTPKKKIKDSTVKKITLDKIQNWKGNPPNFKRKIINSKPTKKDKTANSIPKDLRI